MGTAQVAAAITMATVAIVARQTLRETTVHEDYRMNCIRQFAAWPAENPRAVYLVGIVAMVT